MSTTFAARATYLLAGLMVLAGCGSTSVAPASERDISHLRVVGKLYGLCMSAKGGAAPANQGELVAFIQRDPSLWNKLAATPDELLTSPRDGQPLVFVFGKAVKDPVEGGFAWIAHEAAGVDGQQAVINLSGGIQFVDSAEVAKYFPAS